MSKPIFGDKIITRTLSKSKLEVTIISKSHFSCSILFKSLIKILIVTSLSHDVCCLYSQ